MELLFIFHGLPWCRSSVLLGFMDFYKLVLLANGKLSQKEHFMWFMVTDEFLYDFEVVWSRFWPLGFPLQEKLNFHYEVCGFSFK